MRLLFLLIPLHLLLDATISYEKIIEEVFDAIFEMIAEKVYVDDLDSLVVIGFEDVGGNMEAPIGLPDKVSAHDGVKKAFEKERTIEKEALGKELEFLSTLVAYEK